MRSNRLRGRTVSSVPVALLLCTVAFLFLVQRFSLNSPWSAPVRGGASLHLLSEQPAGAELSLDPRGWEPLVSRYLEEFSNVGTLRFVHNSKDTVQVPPKLPTGLPFSGTPRVAARYNLEGRILETELYQTKFSPLLLSGPVRATVPEEFFSKHSPGLDLSSLSKLPHNCSKAVVLDLSSVRLPKGLEEKLTEELERWEFRPNTKLARGLRSPFVYAQWRRAPLIMMGVQNRKAVERELENRYPSSVIKTTATWSAGSRVVGLERSKKPAWVFRGDYLTASPVGGVTRLSDALTELFHEGGYSVSRPFDREFQRLKKGESGWHLALIDNSKANLWWAMLLRWDPKRRDQVEGYLIVQLVTRPKDSE